MRPLSGYQVLDLSTGRGSFCVGLMAEMGARVTRVEVATRKDRADFLKLASNADVLVEDRAPGYLGSLGLGYNRLSEKNPGLVMASVTDFGQDGPYRDFKGCDLVDGALGGWLSVTGLPDAPLKLPDEQAFRTASLFAANGVLLALWRRHETGHGQHVDISVMECVVAALDHVLVRYFYTGEVAQRRGGRYWNDAFAVLPCRDGHILLSIFREWDTMVAWLDSEGMAEDLTDTRWLDREARQAGVEHIIEVLARWTSRHTAAELEEKGQLMRFPWARVILKHEIRNTKQSV